MSAAPFMQLYVADYIGDTLHLTTEQHGAYLLLLMAMWRAGGSLPNDEQKLSRIVGLSPAKWRRISADVLAFFDVADDAITAPVLAKWEAAFRRQSDRSPIPIDLRALVFSRDGKVCAYCGTTEGEFHLDHIFPWSRGGAHSLENLTVACAPCNRSKRDKTVQEWRGEQ
jgi:hypothetical protein